MEDLTDNNIPCNSSSSVIPIVHKRTASKAKPEIIVSELNTFSSPKLTPSQMTLSALDLENLDLRNLDPSLAQRMLEEIQRGMDVRTVLEKFRVLHSAEKFGQHHHRLSLPPPPNPPSTSSPSPSAKIKTVTFDEDLTEEKIYTSDEITNHCE